jgi:hypothetical protein
MVEFDKLRLARCPAVPSNSSSAILPAVVIDTDLPVPAVSRSATSTSAGVNDGGGMMKSAVLTAVPSSVRTKMRPEPVAAGTSVDRLVAVAAVTRARVWLNATRLLATAGSKLVPLMVTAAPAPPVAGEKLAIVGAGDAATVNGSLLVAVPPGAVTLIGPVVAPAGTAVTSCVALAEVTVAVVPLNFTRLSAAVLLKPVPEMVTWAPVGPRPGEKARIAVCEEGWRAIEVRLPAGS